MKKILLAFLLVFPVSMASAEEPVKDFSGEKITFAIKQIGIKAGEAVLSYEGPVKKEGKDYLLIVFRADGMNFFDEEKMYADPRTLFPQMVERNLNIFGNKEKITEYYETDQGKVRIVKTVDGKTTEQIIKKEGTLDNIYCFIYRYRRDGQFDKSKVFAANLPTMDLKIKLERETHLSAGGKKYKAYYLQSDPPKYKLWFAAEDGNIPLRIDGAVGVGSTSMIMRKYEKKI